MTAQEFKRIVESSIRGARVTKQPGYRNFYVQVADAKGRLVAGRLAVEAAWVDRARLVSDLEPLLTTIRRSIGRPRPGPG
ncbi:MAG: hypothetical protein R3190_09755 [Thermoanaerobaculia bacterium]|nr:hypothetical protein [Thermoanaerobaculia bacterium]